MKLNASIGAAGVVYVSMPIIFDPQPAKVVATTVRSTIHTLEASCS
jgi:hypothetical protein